MSGQRSLPRVSGKVTLTKPMAEPREPECSPNNQSARQIGSQEGKSFSLAAETYLIAKEEKHITFLHSS